MLFDISLTQLTWHIYPDLTHLRAPLPSLSLQPTPLQIYDPTTKHRGIYRDVSFNPDEINAIASFKHFLQGVSLTHPLIPDWTDANYLMILSSAHGHHPTALTHLQAYLSWWHDITFTPLSPFQLSLLLKGVVYQLGRDIAYRPICIMDVNQIQAEKRNPRDLLRAMTFLFQAIKRTMFLPGKIECFCFILDMTGLSLYSAPVAFLQDTISALKRLFPECRSRIFIINPPLVVKMSWSIVKGLFSAETNSMIDFLSSTDLSALHQTIHPSQLEHKYGGTLASPQVYWPPPNTFPSSAQVPLHSQDGPEDHKEVYFTCFTEEESSLSEYTANTQLCHREFLHGLQPVPPPTNSFCCCAQSSLSCLLF